MQVVSGEALHGRLEWKLNKYCSYTSFWSPFIGSDALFLFCVMCLSVFYAVTLPSWLKFFVFVYVHIYYFLIILFLFLLQLQGICQVFFPCHHEQPYAINNNVCKFCGEAQGEDGNGSSNNYATQQISIRYGLFKDSESLSVE